MKLHLQWKTLLFSILIPLAVGGVSALITQNGMELFQNVSKPPLAPPNWLFPIVWTILYIMMGIASYLVYTATDRQNSALPLYGIQLVFNFFWSIVFFNLQWYLFAFVWLILLWLLILLTTMRFFQSTRAAGFLMLPYLFWVTFAGYLNFGVYLMNR